jgi:PAS domain S-box-containing protein
MMEELKTKGGQLCELDVLLGRIAKHQQAEHEVIDGELRDIGQRFRGIFDNIAEGVIVVDVGKKLFATVNNVICKMLGYKGEDTTILEMASICPTENSDHFIEQFNKQVNGEFVFCKDVPFKRKDGSLFYADIISIPLTVSGKRYLISFLCETLAQKIKSVLQQNTYLSSHASRLLTETEMKILRLIIKGKSNKEIAKLFHRSIRTIENHRAHLMKKLGTDSSVKLVKRAVAMGLVDISGRQRQGKSPKIR